MLLIGNQLKSGLALFIAVFGLSAAALYGLSQLVDVPNPVTAEEEEQVIIPGQPVEITIVGRNILFDIESFGAGVGVPVTVIFDNQDPGVLHNIHFYTNRSATTSWPNGESPLAQGVRVDTITFTAPESPGSLFYRCDVHPDTMTGIMTVQ